MSQSEPTKQLHFSDDDEPAVKKACLSIDKVDCNVKELSPVGNEAAQSHATGFL